MKEFEIKILSDYDNVAKVNKEVREILEDEGVESYILNAFEICIMESVNNVIKHSYKEQKNNYICVKLRIDSKLIEMEIIDEGEPRLKFEIPDLDFDPKDINNLPESGMGLYIMKQLMDELTYNSKSGKNYFILKKWLY
ncbi:MAG: ATP-binding protein [Melioribacteraceae bacterium]|nr:ATP-binding protein [Melioribacteraceae bacterium]